VLQKDSVHYALYRGADKSLVRPGRKQANVSVRMAWISFDACLAGGKKLDDSSRLDVVEIAHVPAHSSEFVSFVVGKGLISTSVNTLHLGYKIQSVNDVYGKD